MNGQEEYDQLYNEMKVFLEEKIPDYGKVKKCAEQMLKLNRSFPKDLRFRIWEVLMDVYPCV